MSATDTVESIAQPPSPSRFRVEGTEASLATATSGLTIEEGVTTTATDGNDTHPQLHHLSVNFGEATQFTTSVAPKSQSPATTPDAPVVYPELPPVRNFSEAPPTRKYSETSASKRNSELASKNYAELTPSRNNSRGGRRSGAATPGSDAGASATSRPPPPKTPPVTQSNANDASARNLYVSSLPNNFTTQQLYQMFAAFGPVLSARFMPPRGVTAGAADMALPLTNTSGDPLPADSSNYRGFGFVCYEKEEDANRAMLSMIGTVVAGSKIQVRPSRRHSDGGHISTPQPTPTRNISSLSQRSGGSGGAGLQQSQTSLGGSGSVLAMQQQQQQHMFQQQQQQAVLSGSGQTYFMNAMPAGQQFFQVAPGTAMPYATAAPVGQYMMAGPTTTYFTQAPATPMQAQGQLGFNTSLTGSGSLQASGTTMIGSGGAQYFTPGGAQWVPAGPMGMQMAPPPQQQNPNGLSGSGGPVDFGGTAFYATGNVVVPQGSAPAYGQAAGNGMFVVMPPPPYQM